MIIHFVYSVPFLGKPDALRRKALIKAQRLGLDVSAVGDRTRVDVSRWPFNAPYSITSHVYRALSARATTKLYSLDEATCIQGGPDDILIGHPLIGHEDTVWNRSCRDGRFGARIALLPAHFGLPEFMTPFDPYVDRIDHFLAITGSYWFDHWEAGPFARWKPKMTHVDMAVDIARYPRVKKRFNPPGKRKFLFIGNALPCKGAPLLSLLFGLAKDQECVWIGTGGLPNLSRRPYAALTPEYMAQVAEECDFFITMGISDANPTTILEAMAWGFPVLCTPQTGYYDMPELNPVSTTDMARNLEVLHRMQHAPEEELLAQADAARRLVERHFTWERFTRTVVTGVERVAREKGLAF